MGVQDYDLQQSNLALLKAELKVNNSQYIGQK